MTAFMNRSLHSSEGYDPFVQELIRFSRHKPRKRWLRRERQGAVRQSPSVDANFWAIEDNHAEPLNPLRHRDIQALLEIFTHDRITEIEADIHQYLRRVYPEPCWEVEPYEFLRGFL